MENLVVLQPSHKDQILDFEKSRLPGEDLKSQMLAWDARWRAEALDHYLSLGWSFGQIREGGVNAYVLAQPFLFFKGWTQTLWIEWISADSPEGGQAMVETVYRWARDKHFQTLAFEKDVAHAQFFRSSAYPVHEMDGILFVKTSKMK